MFDFCLFVFLEYLPCSVLDQRKTYDTPAAPRLPTIGLYLATNVIAFVNRIVVGAVVKITSGSVDTFSCPASTDSLI